MGIAFVARLTRSKSRNFRMRNLAGMHVQLAEFRTARERRHALAGIEQAALIERSLDAQQPFELGRLELLAHPAHFFDTDAMLTRDRPADFDARGKIAAPKASVRSTSPLTLASNRIKGCKLPSPA
jgi:hypothetical protein